MVDESFFDANGQVLPERLDDFVAHLRAESVKRGGHMPVSIAAVNAFARKRALANGNDSVGVGVVKGATAQDGVGVEGKPKG